MIITRPILDLWHIPSRYRVARNRYRGGKIGEIEAGLRDRSDTQLTERSLALRYRAQCREPLEKLVVETYALVREAARRTIGLRHYDEQIQGGLALFDGGIAEMQTGEGKTLVATLPLALRGLSRKGALLATANDYLAQRDAEWMGPIYRLLGMTVGVVISDTLRDQRRAAYACDVTYGTAREFGFDFLRDRLARRQSGDDLLAWLPGQDFARATAGSTAVPGAANGAVQREPNFILVDEADSLLIDEARTPLILSGGPPATAAVTAAGCRWGALVAEEFVEQEHFEFDEQRRKVALSAAGRDKVRLLSAPRELEGLKIFSLYEFVETAILVRKIFHRDQQYVVRDGEVVIVDEFTGRLSEGRRWQAGIHQAIEAREGLIITPENQALARISVQQFFLRFPHLAGMTGTASSAARELWQLYRLRVVPIALHRPVQRIWKDDRVFATAAEKWTAIVAETSMMRSVGRPVLIGTRSIHVSEIVSQRLSEAGIEHAVLNARDPAAEAEIVAQAGQARKVTVATNMAGRGTDIQLGDGVAERGGLCVLGTEMHDSARIDQQLSGRCGRQGDPGSFQQFLSLEDDLLRTAFGADRAEATAADALARDAATASRRLVRLFAKAQRLIERRHRRDRVQLQHLESRRQQMHREMGQDPYLDSPE